MTLGNLIRHSHPASRVVRRNPAHFVASDWDHLVNDVFGGFGLAPVALNPRRFNPSFEAVELENEYRVTAELPGVDPADLDVTVEDGVLTIAGQRRFENAAAADETEEAAENVEGRFQRRIRFPGEVVESAAKASYKNGLLTVTVPKPEERKPEVRSIPVETS